MRTYELNLQPFCESCPYFEDEVVTIKSPMLCSETGRTSYNRIISCKHMGKCKQIFNNMRKMYEENKWE